MPFDVTRLRSWLNNSKLQTTNNPAWQLLSTIIGFIQENSDEIIKLHNAIPTDGADPNTVLHGALDPRFRQVATEDIYDAAITTDQIFDGSVTEVKQTLADVTTWDVSITRHGYAPKLPNDATKYLDGQGNYTIPAGSGGGAGTVTNIATGSYLTGGPITTTGTIDASTGTIGILEAAQHALLGGI